MAASTAEELSPFKISSSDIKGLEDKISKGEGSWGIVYAVTVKGIPRIAKRLHNILINHVSPAEREGVTRKFLDECRLLSRLDHPNIVKFVGVHFKDGDRFDVTLIMERLHIDLKKFLDPEQRPHIDLFTKLSILLDVSSGLLYLHTHCDGPIIHRDLNAGNVLLTKDFKHAKIADLGVSKLLENHTRRAATQTRCPGALDYMPPEALREKPKYDTPLDVFSFGHLALYLCIQQPPELSHYDEISPEAHQTGEVAIRKRQKWISMLPEDHCLRRMILSCLRDDPQERPTTESLNINLLRVLCGLELEELEVKEIVEIEGGYKCCGSFGAVCEVICRGAPRIAKQLTAVLNMRQNINPSQRQIIQQKFHSECLTLSKLDHPNIVKFVGIHFNPSDPSDMAIIMEHLLMCLECYLDPHEASDIHLNTKLSILLDVSAGMLYLHTQLKIPVVHGELVAANVLLTEDLKEAKIADLGVSKLLQEPVYEPTQGKYLAYLPPEAFSKDPKYGTTLDIFSFGHLALYVALQEFPVVSNEQLTISRKKQELEILKRKKWIDKLPHDHCLRDLILSCLKDKPEKRPTTAEINNIMKALCSENFGRRKNEYDVELQNQFAELCRSGQLLPLKAALYHYREVFDHCTTKGNTLLHEAVDADKPEVVQLLLLHGVDPNIQTKQGLTPLHMAVSKGLVDCTHALLENGADITVRDSLGQDAITKAEIRGKKCEAILKVLRSKEIVLLAKNGSVKELEKRLNIGPKPEMMDIEEALLMSIRNGNDDCVPLLIVAGARLLDCALCLAIQLERIKAIATLLLCRAAITGDTSAIRSFLSGPPESANVPWYIPMVKRFFSQGNIKMNMIYPIAVSIFEKKYEATKEVLLHTNFDMIRKQVDWSELKLTILHPSWMYSIAPWVVSLNLSNNDLRRLPHEIFSATQLRRLDLSQNMLDCTMVVTF